MQRRILPSRDTRRRDDHRERSARLFECTDRIDHTRAAGYARASALSRLSIVGIARIATNRNSTDSRIGASARPQTLGDLRARKRGIDRDHQRGHARHERSGKTRPHVEVELIGVAMRARRRRTKIGGGIDRIETRLVRAGVHAITAWCANRGVGAQTAEADFGAGMPKGNHRHYALATRGCRYRSRFVASRCDDHDAISHELVDHRLIGGRTTILRAQTQIEHSRRIRVRGDTRDGESTGPTHAGQDVRVVTTTFAEHPDRQDPRPPSETGNTRVVV